MYYVQPNYFSTQLQKEITLLHKEKIKAFLQDLHKSLSPILKKFNLSYALLTESPIFHDKVASTQKIRINVSPPNVKEKSFIYTHHLQLKIRNLEKPNDSSLFLNKTTALAIMLHELSHINFPGHEIDFMTFLRDIYQFAWKCKIFPENKEEHMIPSIREVERKIFEQKGSVTNLELLEIYNKSIKELQAIDLNTETKLKDFNQN